MNAAERGRLVHSGSIRLPITTTSAPRTIHGSPPTVASTPALVEFFVARRRYRLRIRSLPSKGPLSTTPGAGTITS